MTLYLCDRCANRRQTVHSLFTDRPMVVCTKHGRRIAIRTDGGEPPEQVCGSYERKERGA